MASHRIHEDTTSREVARSLEPTRAVVLECIPFEKGCVESVCVITEFLKVFQGDIGSEGRAPQVLEQAVETVGSKANQ